MCCLAFTSGNDWEFSLWQVKWPNPFAGFHQMCYSWPHFHRDKTSPLGSFDGRLNSEGGVLSSWSLFISCLPGSFYHRMLPQIVNRQNTLGSWCQYYLAGIEFIWRPLWNLFHRFASHPPPSKTSMHFKLLSKFENQSLTYPLLPNEQLMFQGNVNLSYKIHA